MSTLRSHVAILKQIEELQRQLKEAEREREEAERERIAAIEHVKQVIGEHSIEAWELGYSKQSDLRPAPNRARATRRMLPEPGKVYVSPSGAVWDGTGKKPEWLLQQLKRGASMADFAQPANAPREGRKGFTAGALYRGLRGHEWVGGTEPVPGWVSTALRRHGSLARFRVKVDEAAAKQPQGDTR